MRSPAAEGVLLRFDILNKVLGHLTRKEAAGLLLVSEDISKLARALFSNNACRPRLVVGSSRNSMLVEINPVTGKVVKAGRTARRSGRRKGLSGSWITGLAFSPWDGDLYVAQYQINGIEVYDGRSLRKKAVFSRAPELAAPEGLAFNNGALFVASAHFNTVVKLDARGKVLQVIPLEGIRAIGRDVAALDAGVPWGLAAGFLPGCDHLFVAHDTGFHPGPGETYGDAPDTKQGAVVEILRGPGAKDYTLHASSQGVSRPSGIHVLLEKDREGDVDPEKCRILITASHSPLLSISYKELKSGGSFREVARQELGLERGDKLWDVCVASGHIFATVHTGQVDHRSRVHQLSMSGSLTRRIESDSLQEGNMMAVQF